MENNSPKSMKVPMIVIGVAGLVILAGVLVRSGNSPSSQPTPEPASGSAPAPVTATQPDPSQQPRFSSLAATDDNGGNWTLGLAGVPPEARENGKKPGVPLSVKADVQGYGQNISIGLIIEGQAGEVYEPGAARDGRRRPAPKFKVFDESGEVLGSGSFEYG